MTTNAIQSQGILVEREKGASPGEWETIGEITSFTGPGGSATVIDATHLLSQAKEKLMGLPDEGQFSFEANLVPGDAGQVGLRNDRIQRVARNFRITLTDTNTTQLTFLAYVLGFSINGQVDGKVNANVTLEISGPVTWA